MSAPAPGGAAGRTRASRSRLQVNKHAMPGLYESQVLKASKSRARSHPLSIDAWLKKNISSVKREPHIEEPDRDNYDEVLRYLIRSKDIIKPHADDPLRGAILFGYYLQLLFDNKFNENSSGVERLPIETVLSDHIGIKRRYANELRWLAKLGHQYPKLGNVSLCLYKVFKKRPDITFLFKCRPHLANEWK